MRRSVRQRGSQAVAASQAEVTTASEPLTSEGLTQPTLSPIRRRSRTPGIPPIVYWLLGASFILEYSRIPSIFPVIGAVRLQMLLLVGLAICLLRFADKDILKQPVTKWTLAFAMLCGLGILYTPNTRAAFNMMLNILTCLVAVILPLIAFVKTIDRMRWFLGIFVTAASFVALWSLTHAGRGPGGFIGDENDCAFVLNFALPFGVALMAWPGQGAGARWYFRACTLVMLLGSLATVSRGGFLGLVAGGLAGFWYSKRKMRIIGIATLIFAFSGVIAPLVLPPNYIEEMQSISNTEDGTRQNRVYFWKLGWMMYKSNPVLGVGAGNYPWTVADYERQLPPDELFRNRYSGGRPAHSLYFTLLPELGTVGVILFAGLAFLTFKAGLALRRTAHSLADIEPTESGIRERLGTAIIASLAASLVTAMFISVLYYPCFWHLTGIAAAASGLAIGSTAPEADKGDRKRRART